MSVAAEPPSLGDSLEAARRAAEEDLLLGTAAQALTADTGTEGFGFENIVGVGALAPVGSADEEAVAIYVVRKVPSDRLDEAVRIPESYEGVRTEIIEAGEFVTLTQRGRYRPVPVGVSVGHVEGETGTVGFFAERAGDMVLVSNNHVLAKANGAELGDPIIQPGRADLGGAGDEVGALAAVVDLDFSGGRNRIDAACAQVNEAEVVQSLSEGGGFIAEAQAARPNAGVFKCGRTTGVTQGLIVDIAATVKVRYRQGIALLSDQILVHGVEGPFSAAGDSGSLVIDSVARRPVGMVCGGSPTHTVINKIDHILMELGLSFA
ncbi:MAG: hypothetical protein ACRDPE_00270 [Solirubrobacterales bacterium]